MEIDGFTDLFDQLIETLYLIGDYEVKVSEEGTVLSSLEFEFMNELAISHRMAMEYFFWYK